MRIRRSNKPSAFTLTIFLKKGEIDSMCEDALKKAKLYPEEPKPIQIEALIECHFEAKLDFGTDMGNNVLGFTIFAPSGKPEVVGISPSLDEGTKVSERRIRSVLAHEAGHCMIHPILFTEQYGTQGELSNSNVDVQRRRILCKKEDINASASGKGRYDGRWWEYQANCAIGGFLLPLRLVNQCVADLTQAVGTLGNRTLPGKSRNLAEQKVAEIFEVNPVVARIRLSNMFPDTPQMEL